MAAAHQRLEEQCRTIGQPDGSRLDDLGQQRADTYIEPGQAQDGGNLRDILQIEEVACVLFAHEQKFYARHDTVALQCSLEFCCRKRMPAFVQIVEPRRVKIRVD